MNLLFLMVWGIPAFVLADTVPVPAIVKFTSSGTTNMSLTMKTGFAVVQEGEKRYRYIVEATSTENGEVFLDIGAVNFNITNNGSLLIKNLRIDTDLDGNVLESEIVLEGTSIVSVARSTNDEYFLAFNYTPSSIIPSVFGMSLPSTTIGAAALVKVPGENPGWLRTYEGGSFNGIKFSPDNRLFGICHHFNALDAGNGFNFATGGMTVLEVDKNNGTTLQAISYENSRSAPYNDGNIFEMGPDGLYILSYIVDGATVDFGNSMTLTSTSYWDGYLVKFGYDLEVQWAKAVNAENGFFMPNLTMALNGKLWLTLSCFNTITVGTLSITRIGPTRDGSVVIINGDGSIYNSYAIRSDFWEDIESLIPVSNTEMMVLLRHGTGKIYIDNTIVSTGNPDLYAGASPLFRVSQDGVGTSGTALKNQIVRLISGHDQTLVGMSAGYPYSDPTINYINLASTYKAVNFFTLGEAVPLNLELPTSISFCRGVTSVQVPFSMSLGEALFMMPDIRFSGALTIMQDAFVVADDPENNEYLININLKPGSTTLTEIFHIQVGSIQQQEVSAFIPINNNPVPSIISTAAAEHCGPGSLVLTAFADQGIPKWYADNTSDVVLGTGIYFDTPSISSTTSYYAVAESSGCSSSRSEVIAVIIPIPSITSTTDGEYCGTTGSVTLSAIASDGILNWYADNTSEVVLGTGNDFNTPSISSTTSYYVKAVFSGCSSSRSEVTAFSIPNPSITSITDGEHCGAGSVALSAIASDGILNWYADNISDVVLGTGNDFTTPLITSTTTYYVAAEFSGCTSDRSEVTAVIGEDCVTSILGTSSYDSQKMSLYPNPASEYMTVKLDMVTPLSYQLEVVSANGEKVYSTHETQDMLNLSLGHLSEGTYSVHVKTETGYHAVQKLVIIK